MAAPSNDGTRALRGPLLRWYRRRRRDLPWRRTRDPYAIWVSEVMLQQTRVATVVPYYERFIAAFPDLRALARARVERVLALWSGLGYYGRARALHRASRLVVERHGGELPRDPATLGELPGVGPYTAGAIASLAFGFPEPVLDGNVHRVLSRLLARRGGGAREDRRLLAVARALVEGGTPGDLNQALMELGATVCTPRAPRCAECPLARRCQALSRGRPEAYPAPGQRPAGGSARVAVALVWRGTRLLLERPGDGSPFRGSWDLPGVEIASDADAARAIESALSGRHGISVHVDLAPVARATHSILDRRLRLELLSCRLAREPTGPGGGARWARIRDLERLPISGATWKLVRLVTASPTAEPTRRSTTSPGRGPQARDRAGGRRRTASPP